jgi:long-chain fatty acid transport protein
MRRAAVKALAATLGVAAVLTAAADVGAAGLYFSDRGTRPLARGGAFVAGADDLGAIWYNPAGIVDAPTGFLVDATWLHYTSEFTRQAQTTSATGTTFVQSFPGVSGSTPILPVPTIAGSYRFGDKQQYAVALGMYAPMVPVTTYPMTISNPDGSSSPAPQRYSLVSLDGSLLVVTGAWFAWRPIEQLRVGAGFQMLVGTFKSTVDFSACPPDNLVCAGENPSYDAYSQLNVGPIVTPSGNFGATYVPMKKVRIGASAQLPFAVDAPAKVDVRLPTAVVFDNAYQQGDDARVKFTLPAVARIGVEVRPLDDQDLRIELAYVREFWSEQQSIAVTPTDIQLYKITGFPSPFAVSPISIPRGGQDSNSIRLGGEYKLPIDPYVLQLRAGLAYESSGIQQNYVSPLTIDSDKYTAALGGGLFIGKHWRFDAVYAHVFMADVNVSPATAAVPRVNPVQGNPTQTAAVNGGHYSAGADAIGIGMQYAF